MFFEDEQSLLSISSSIKAIFEDGAGSLQGSSSGKACFEDERDLWTGIRIFVNHVVTMLYEKK